MAGGGMGALPYSIELTCAVGMERVIPSSPATVSFVAVFSITLPPTLVPSRKITVTGGALSVEAVCSLWEQEVREIPSASTANISCRLMAWPPTFLKKV
jgi:hypothetical protein